MNQDHLFEEWYKIIAYNKCAELILESILNNNLLREETFIQENILNMAKRYFCFRLL